MAEGQSQRSGHDCTSISKRLTSLRVWKARTKALPSTERATPRANVSYRMGPRGCVAEGQLHSSSCPCTSIPKRMVPLGVWKARTHALPAAGQAIPTTPICHVDWDRDTVWQRPGRTRAGAIARSSRIEWHPWGYGRPGQTHRPLQNRRYPRHICHVGWDQEAAWQRAGRRAACVGSLQTPPLLEHQRAWEGEL